MNFLLSNSAIDKQSYANLPYILNHKCFQGFHFLSEDRDCLKEAGNYFYTVDGYIRDLSEGVNEPPKQEKAAIERIVKLWPVPQDITGSFSSLIIDKTSLEITVCNDLIGIYPLYYLKSDSSFYISNSIILLGSVSRCGFDNIGIVQRCMGPEYSTIGSRTILLNAKRLLPGEFLKFDKTGNLILKKYDNTLYQNLPDSNQSPNLQREFWKEFKKEIQYCLSNSKEVNIALSGGIDSRILFGAIPSGKKIKSITYGSKENYETKIAKRLSKIKGAVNLNFSQPELFFPQVETIKKYTLKTEALYLCSWLEILENINTEQKKILLLGDLTTALTGRTIEKFSSKKFKQENFVKYYIRKKDYSFQPPTKENVEKWKLDKIKSFELWYGANNITRLSPRISKEKLLAGLHQDLKELFERIESHNLPYIELYDEIFSWYTHTRMVNAKQILVCQSKFHCYCPSMSIQVMRISSSIPPNLRLNFRYIQTLFREKKELIQLAKLPTSQAPLVPQNYPDIIKFLMWGMRSKIDYYLIKRMIRKKDINLRYRLFPSMNWAKIYQNPEMLNNLHDYFKNNFLGEQYFEFLLRQALDRKNLEQWPFVNLEIINAASLNSEIEFINTARMKNEV